MPRPRGRSCDANLIMSHLCPPQCPDRFSTLTDRPRPRNATANTQSCEPMLGAQRNRTHESRMRREASENQRVQAPYSQTRFMTAVGFEPTQLALAELESAPLDHSGMLSWRQKRDKAVQDTKPPAAGRRYELTSSAPERQAPPCHVHSRANKALQRPE